MQKGKNQKQKKKQKKKRHSATAIRQLKDYKTEREEG